MEKQPDSVRSQNPAEFALLLDALASHSPYAADAVQFYHDGVAAHENGQDLLQFLLSTEWPTRSTGTEPPARQLSLEAAQFVAAATGEEDDTRQFRARYAISFESTPSFARGDKRPLEEKFAAESKTFRLFRIFETESINVDEVLLDSQYDSEGRLVDGLDPLHAQMVVLCAQLEHAELAQHFASQINGLPYIVDTYFALTAMDSATARTVLEDWRDLRARLDADPRLLVSFLTREIAEIGPKGGVNIDANVADALVLISDDRYFYSNLTTLISSPKYDYSTQTAKQKLAEALIAHSEYQKAFIILHKLSAMRGVEPPDVAGQLDRARINDFSWRERRRIKALAKSALRAQHRRKEQATMPSDALTAWIVLDVLGVTKSFTAVTSTTEQMPDIAEGQAVYLREQKSKITMQAKEVIWQQAQALRVPLGRLATRAAKPYDVTRDLHSDNTVPNRLLATLRQFYGPIKKDQVYNRLVRESRATPLQKLKAATVMAQYVELPEIQLSIQAQIESALAFLQDEQDRSAATISAVERTRLYQLGTREILATLPELINSLHDPRLRTHYSEKLQTTNQTA